VLSGGERTKLTGHKDELRAFALSPDGRTLASGSMDGTVPLWDLLSGQEVGRLGKEVDPVKGGWVLDVAFSPDGRTLVSGGLDKIAHTSRRRSSALSRTSSSLPAGRGGVGDAPSSAFATPTS
jgi:WD40 repeat protein